jgi:hypothetical protein
MIYIRVKWMHSHATEPIWIYSELDTDRWELRKVEIYVDGRMGFADKDREINGSMLSIEPLPSLPEIAADPQFEIAEIGRDEFEEIWAKAAAR